MTLSKSESDHPPDQRPTQPPGELSDLQQPGRIEWIDESPQSGTTAATRRDIPLSNSPLVAALRGDVQALHDYIATREFSFANVPSWVVTLCHDVAVKHFEQNRRDIFGYLADEWSLYDVSGNRMMLTGMRLFISKLKGPGGLDSATCKRVQRVLDKISFNKKRFNMLGLKEIGSLKQLTSIAHEGFQDATHFASEKKSTSAFSKLFAFYNSIDTAPPQQRDRLVDIRLGLLADESGTGLSGFSRSIHKAVVEHLVPYVVLNDLFREMNIPLSPQVFSALIHRLRGQSPEECLADSHVRIFVNYADRLAAGEEVSDISRYRAFNSFAASKRPFEDLLEADRAQARIAVPHVDVSTVSAPTTKAATMQSSPLVPSPVQRDNESERERRYRTILTECLGTENGPPRELKHLILLCRRVGIKPGDLESLCFERGFDVAAVKRGLHDRTKASGPSAEAEKTKSGQERRHDVGLTARPEPFQAFIHSEGSRSPFHAWFEQLRPEWKRRVLNSIEAVRCEHVGNVKRLDADHSDDSVNLHEIRIFDGGLRIYFRYLPGRRIVILGGGYKNTQNLDIPRFSELAGQYNGIAPDAPLNLSRVPSTPRN